MAAIIAFIGPLITLINKLLVLFQVPTQSKIENDRRIAEEEAEKLKHTGRPS